MWCSVGASQAQCWWKASNFFHRNEKWIEMRAHTEWAILFSKMIKHTKAPTKFRSHIIPLLAKEWALGFLLGTRSVNLQVLGSRDCGGGFNTLVSCKSERFMRWWWKLPACSHPPSTSPLFLSVPLFPQPPSKSLIARMPFYKFVSLTPLHNMGNLCLKFKFNWFSCFKE